MTPAAAAPSPPAGVGQCAPGLGIGLLEVPRATLKDPRARNYVIDVSKRGAPKNDFTIDSLQAVRGKDGTPAVLAKVHNTGARALDMRGSLQLSDGPAGLSAGPFDAQLGTTLAPGDTAPVVVPLDKA